MNNKKRNAFCSYCFVMTKRVILSLLLVLCLLATCPAQSVTLTISNPTSAQRSELVAIDAATLGIEVGKGVVVRDVSNIERPTQWTHDGKLLMEVHVRPHGKAVFTLQPGTPAAFLSWVDGRQYPERWDDIAFENDRIGFRLYGPALQKHGEKGYGYDLWVKRTTELVLGELYRNDPRLSFHLDYGKGVDCFAVGPTLGCGTPAMLQNGEIRFPWCYETYKILDKGPLRFTVQVDFPTTADGITEHRILSLDKGSNFVESTVWYEGLKRPTDVLAGFPVRSAGAETLVKGDNYIQYADPTIEPERYQTQVYVALLFPDQTVDIDVVQQHGVGILRRYTSGQRFHYFIGAAWSEFDVRSQAEWQCRINGFMQMKKNPLQITLNK
jgi:hypothetical protein